MKKSILIIAVFALVAAAAFAQITLNKSIVVGTSLATGTYTASGGFSTVDTKSERMEYSLYVEGKSQDGTFGFGAEFDRLWNPGVINGWAWWQPIPEITIALGDITWYEIPLGTESGQITGWSLNNTNIFHMDEPDDQFWVYNGYPGSVLRNMHGFYQGAAGSTVDFQPQFSGAVSIFPLTWFGVYTPNKLGFHFYFPTLAGNTGDGMTDTLKSVYIDRMEAQVSFDIADVGQAAISFRNSLREKGLNDSDATYYYDKSKAFYAQWRMSLPKKMGFEASVNYNMAPPDGKYRAKWPINAGIGWIKGDIWSDPLTLTSRMGLQFPMEDFQNFILGWDFVANIRIAGVRLYLPVGVGLIFPSNGPTGPNIIAGKGQDTVVYWAFSPYVVKTIAGGPQIYLCLRIDNGQLVGWPRLGPSPPHNGQITADTLAEYMQRGKVIKWNVPVYLSWRF